jgi:hypothetical protein
MTIADSHRFFLGDSDHSPDGSLRYNGDMTESLQRAFDAASQLPAPDQDAIASWIMAELESESKWSNLFANSQDALSSLADTALAEHARSETRDLDKN